MGIKNEARDFTPCENRVCDAHEVVALMKELSDRVNAEEGLIGEKEGLVVGKQSDETMALVGKVADAFGMAHAGSLKLGKLEWCLENEVIIDLTPDTYEHDDDVPMYFLRLFADEEYLHVRFDVADERALVPMMLLMCFELKL